MQFDGFLNMEEFKEGLYGIRILEGPGSTSHFTLVTFIKFNNDKGETITVDCKLSGCKDNDDDNIKIDPSNLNLSTQ